MDLMVKGEQGEVFMFFKKHMSHFHNQKKALKDMMGILRTLWGRKQKQLDSEGKIVAEMSFGFWVNLHNNRAYSSALINKGLLKFVYSNCTNKDMKDRAQLMYEVQKHRNRIFHQEYLKVEATELKKDMGLLLSTICEEAYKTFKDYYN